MSTTADLLPTAAPVLELIPVLVLHIKAQGESIEIYKNPSKDVALNRVIIESGVVNTLDNKLGLVFNGTDITGADELTISPSTGVARLDCRLYGKTANGSGFYFTYTGALKINEAAGKTLSQQSSLADFADIDLTSNARITLDGGADEKDLWVQKENFVGRGRFIRDSAGELYVQYYIYVVR